MHEIPGVEITGALDTVCPLDRIAYGEQDGSQD